jgi:hypothetical protein
LIGNTNPNTATPTSAYTNGYNNANPWGLRIQNNTQRSLFLFASLPQSSL